MLPNLNRRFLLRVFLVSFTLVLSLATLQAGVIAQINFGYHSIDGGWTIAEPYDSTTGYGDTVLKGEWGGDFPPEMYIANGARAMADGLSLHVDAGAGIYHGVLGSGYPDYTYAEAIATASDMLLIASSTPGLDGTSATAIFGIGISGAIYLNGPNAEAGLWLNNQLIASADGAYDQTAYLPFDFVFGQQFAFGSTLKARAAVGAAGVPDYFYTSNVSFFDTATIDSVSVTQNGQPITNFTITSQEGLTYPGQGQVPEPGAWALSGAGLLAFCISRLRRR